ncbi:MAG TPA: hypothetical protein VER58_03920 [Thermoanaerobaculia bacterium]|nr:hypothetical protein [Thermoanaerobaculia bacterium]
MSDHRIELHCPRCGQTNARYSGWRSILNPKWAEFCTLCGAHLVTGERFGVDVAFGGFLMILIYGLHALVGAGLFLIVSALFMVGRLNPAWLDRLSLLLPVAGAAAGVALAEWSRRQGTLLSNRRAPK